ncbi:hypothetical protein F3Y22_tig00110485pilonHSYRG00146 [Hibiscus syriacus]|uniref:WAT1-related protein n=1 Tax=Hibiscus syriacus TaxID=106335 RepID=A0A6A3ADV8_HIBSY|nr:hypothetical protein F3Y22_tig00110485pilonHSYRG00146 [Hibiscus syriacus]
MVRIAHLVPLIMVLVQLIFAGMNVMYKLAANDGMSLRLIVVYRFMFASAIMVPLALIFERKSLEKINRKIALQGFLCGLFGGALAQNFYLQSLVYTSATFVAAMINLAPACVFILAICFKYNSYSFRFPVAMMRLSRDGETGNKNKSRAGKSVWDINRNIWSNVVHILQRRRDTHLEDTFKPSEASPIGEKFGIIRHQQVCSRRIFRSFEYHFILFVADHTGLQGALIALCTVRDWSQWKLGWNVRLLAVAYVGIMGSALLVFLVSWAVRMMGPLYASIFNPLGLVFVAILGSLLLDEKLYVGSIVGGLMIVCGVYVVLWGKAKEAKQKTQLVPLPTADIDPYEKPEKDKQSEIKETDEEDTDEEEIETPHAVVLA